MALIFSRSRERARRRKALYLRVGRWLLLLGLFLGIGYSSYEAGLALADLKVSRIQGQLAAVTGERDEARAARIQTNVELKQAREQSAALQARYQADVPTGDLAGLLQRLRERINDGVPPARLDEAITAARAVTPCEGAVDSKRIAFRTKTRSQAADNTSFVDGLIGVYVTREADADGQPLTAHFRVFPDVDSVATGPVPLRHAVVVGNVEFRFVVTLSDLRGFVVIAMNTCGR